MGFLWELHEITHVNRSLVDGVILLLLLMVVVIQQHCHIFLNIDLIWNIELVHRNEPGEIQGI